MGETGAYVIMVSFLLFRQPASCVPGPLQSAADIYWWEFCLPANSSGSRRVSCAIHLGGWATGCQALSCWPSPLESWFRRKADLWIHCVRWVQCTEQILYWGKRKNSLKEKTKQTCLSRQHYCAIAIIANNLLLSWKARLQLFPHKCIISSTAIMIN